MHRISTLLSIDVIVGVVHSVKTELLKPITLISSGTAIELFVKPFTASTASMSTDVMIAVNCVLAAKSSLINLLVHSMSFEHL